MESLSSFEIFVIFWDSAITDPFKYRAGGCAEQANMQ